MNEEQ